MRKSKPVVQEEVSNESINQQTEASSIVTRNSKQLFAIAIYIINQITLPYFFLLFLCDVICIIIIESIISTAPPLSTRTIDSSIESIDQHSDIRSIIDSDNKKEQQQVFYRSIININTTNKDN
jgi:hypothetical protein